MERQQHLMLTLKDTLWSGLRGDLMSQRSANYKRQGQKGMKCLGLTPWNVASIKENHLSVKCLKRYFRYSTRTDMVNDTQYRLHSVPKSNYLKWSSLWTRTRHGSIHWILSEFNFEKKNTSLSGYVTLFRVIYYLIRYMLVRY